MSGTVGTSGKRLFRLTTELSRADSQLFFHFHFWNIDINLNFKNAHFPKVLKLSGSADARVHVELKTSTVRSINSACLRYAVRRGLDREALSPYLSRGFGFRRGQTKKIKRACTHASEYFFIVNWLRRNQTQSLFPFFFWFCARTSYRFQGSRGGNALKTTSRTRNT